MENKKGLMLGIEIGALVIALGAVIAVMLLLKKDEVKPVDTDNNTSSNG